MGRSVMISDFLVQHPSGAFFQLTEDEWRKAVQKFPELLDDSGLRYAKNSATVTSYLGADPYLDNTIILMQFERLFKMLTFKEDYRDHEIEILVDNARTHTARPFSIADFGKGSEPAVQYRPPNMLMTRILQKLLIYFSILVHTRD